MSTFDTTAKKAATTGARATTAIKLALIGGVAALAGCSSSSGGTELATPTGGPTYAVARGFKAGSRTTTTTANGVVNSDTVTTAQVNLASSRAGDTASLAVADAVAADGTQAAIPGSVTLRGSTVATPVLALQQIGTGTSAPGTADNNTSTTLTSRVFGTAAASSTPTNPEPDDGNDSLTVIDAEYARIAIARVAPTDENNLQAGIGYTAGPNAADVERVVPTDGTVTYSGTAVVSGLAPSEADIFGGEVALTADFGANSVEGDITFADANEQVRLRNGRIAGADYEGTATIVDPTGARTYKADPASQNGRNAFRGGFYGPGADETAGVVDFRGTVTNNATGTTERFDGIGSYIATKDAPAVPARP